MSMSLLRSLSRKTSGLLGAQARAMSSSPEHSFQLEDAFKSHLCDLPESNVTATSDEMMDWLRTMVTMRRMEITCDTEYKARNIRGFCHLYDGQEAIAMGTQAALEKEDSWITSYRCHCTALLRGGSVKGVLAELFGFMEGLSHGKGGSMHMYNREHNFWGGAGIVGAQVPVGAGAGFANRYAAQRDGTADMQVSVMMFGDGAANQGQIWEAANMSALWDLPNIFVIENNQYGMGTSSERSSSNNAYYTQGNRIPGIWVNGMDVFAVRSGMAFAKAHCAAGKGPMFIEFNTYRYHGHSMSDPGTTYRDRGEIKLNRETRDPLDLLKKRIIECGAASAEEVKALEKEVRKTVQEAVAEAKKGSMPPMQELITDVYQENGKGVYPPFIRMPDYAKSAVNGVYGAPEW